MAKEYLDFFREMTNKRLKEFKHIDDIKADLEQGFAAI